MPLGLKNARATYQRLVNRMFMKQLGKNVEAYVDDMIVKSHLAAWHHTNLEETFATLRRHQLKLNHEKLVVQQVSNQCEAKEDRMSRYVDKAIALLSGFPKVVMEQVPCEENTMVDSLSKLATEDLEAKGVYFVELLRKEESHSRGIIMNVEEEKCWMTPIKEYPEKAILPSNPLEAKRL
ncbi:hypothetical protein CRG98_027440 [Punica granatum]|uniref:Reverse transcriptase domain-containing protein n=1 Tax=Punica granatum TaxID=22663 RepID=A0A2I0J8G2_PUNGR|nr:hypothetical protein CRG98_027440 [Punica granatum]